MQTVSFLILNSCILISSYLLSFNLLKIRSNKLLLISVLLIYFSQIVIIELLLGIFGVLNIGNVLLLALISLLFAYTLKNKFGSDRKLRFPKFFAFEFPEDKLTFFLISIVLAFGLSKVFVNLFNPPFGWDSLNYHFTFAVEWLKSQNLSVPITVFDDPSPSYYPINGSLYYLWLILPFKNVFIADLGQLPFFILSAVSVYTISQLIGLKRKHAIYATFIFLLIPNYFKQLSLAYVDVMVCALFLASLVFLIALAKEFLLSFVILFSVSLGLMIGTKTTALPFSLLLILSFIYLLIKNKAKFSYYVCFLLLISILGGFTYFRNFLDTGNPMYPLNLSLFGKSILKGVMDRNVYAAHFKVEDYNILKLLFHEGLGLQTTVFVFPAIFLTLPILIKSKKLKLSPFVIYFSLLPIFLYLVYRYVIPLANIRYLYALLGIGTVFGLFVLENTKIKDWIIKLIVLICGISSTSELAKRQELIASIVLTLVIFCFFCLATKKKINIGIKKVNLAGIVLVFLLLNFGQMYYTKNEYPRYKKMVKYSHFWPDAIDAWIWLNDNTNKANIAYVGRPVPFPLYGKDLSNNVFYVSVNPVEPVKLHYFKSSRYEWGYDFESLHQNLEKENNFRSQADYKVWKRNLIERKTDFLFIYSLHQIKNVIFPIEDKWAKENKDIFLPVFSNKTIHIYKLKNQ